MKKKEYKNAKKKIAEQQSNLVKQLFELRKKYIESNKPCEKEQLIEVVNNGNRKIIGNAKGFGISKDLNVYVDSIKLVNGGMVYLSVEHKSIKLL